RLLEEWSTAVYAEADGEIRFGGILRHSSFGDGGEWSIECAGFVGYAKGIPYLETKSWDEVDPLDVVRELWRHVQEFDPKGDLNLGVDDTTSPVRIGKVQKHVPVTAEDAGTGDSEPTPYALNAWEEKDCGDEMDALAKQTPFDYLEEHAWQGDTIVHRLRLFY